MALYNSIPMRDWKLLAKVLEPNISEEDIPRIAPPLEAIEKEFRPLVAGIPLETEPAYVLLRLPEES